MFLQNFCNEYILQESQTVPKINNSQWSLWCMFQNLIFLALTLCELNKMLFLSVFNKIFNVLLLYKLIESLFSDRCPRERFSLIKKIS